MQPKKLTPRVAQYLDAIVAARERGITWAEIAEVLGARSAPAVRAAAYRARIAVAAGRIRPGEQLPLPAIPPAPAPPPSGGGQSLPPVPGTAPENPAPPVRRGFKHIKLD